MLIVIYFLVLAASLPSAVISEPGSLPDKLNEFFRKIASDEKFMHWCGSLIFVF